MSLLWYIDISLAVLQGVFMALMIRNYVGIGMTLVGKMLIGLSAVFLAESIIMITIYYGWAMANMGMEVALPTLVITLMNLVGVLILYFISRL